MLAINKSNCISTVHMPRMSRMSINYATMRWWDHAAHAGWKMINLLENPHKHVFKINELVLRESETVWLEMHEDVKECFWRWWLFPGYKSINLIGKNFIKFHEK